MLRARNFVFALAFFAILGLYASSAKADTLNFTGQFNRDDNVRIFKFSLLADQVVTLRTTSYANGGFDPVLTLFNRAGVYETENDDGGLDVTPEPLTGDRFDAYLSQPLSAGTYFLALTQHDNFASGFTLSEGFDRDGEGDFTGVEFGSGEGSFLNQFGEQRTSQWTLQLKNVDAAAPVPEPASITLLCSGLLGAIASVRRRRKSCE